MSTVFSAFLKKFFVFCADFSSFPAEKAKISPFLPFPRYSKPMKRTSLLFLVVASLRCSRSNPSFTLSLRVCVAGVAIP